jgi:hypothetical protein
VERWAAANGRGASGSEMTRREDPASRQERARAAVGQGDIREGGHQRWGGRSLGRVGADGGARGRQGGSSTCSPDLTSRRKVKWKTRDLFTARWASGGHDWTGRTCEAARDDPS